MKRFGQAIRVRPEALDDYIKAHAEVWPSVLATIDECNIRNYSIFHHDSMLFAYFEYHGTDFTGDMEKMRADPETQRWWDFVGPMQVPHESRAEGEWWVTMHEIFHC